METRLALAGVRRSKNGKKRREMSERAGGRTSVPQIFVDGQHLGDSDGIQTMEAKGELDAALGLA